MLTRRGARSLAATVLLCVAALLCWALHEPAPAPALEAPTFTDCLLQPQREGCTWPR